MAEVVNVEKLLLFFKRLSEVYAENEAYLTELDSAIGDADHGANMNRGFKAVVSALSGMESGSCSGVLKTVSMQLIRNVGGASGPLYGTFFLKASSSVGGKDELEAVDVLAMFQEGMQGVVNLGKAEEGDKTMIDALAPALRAMEAHYAEGLRPMLESGVEAAEAGMKATLPLVAKKGRASYLAERSVGHQDAGATSSFLLLKTAMEVWV